ncbi:MAG: LysM peptidoglycan-binding domain-containing protein, partial [Cyclobacteriaceae bacterium]
MKSQNIFTIIFFLLLSVSFTLKANDFDSLRLERRPEGHFIIHRVEAGETLYSLSRRYAANLVKIAEVNKLEGYSIDVGQIVAIPYEKNEPEVVAETNRTTHIVKPKETLYAISHIYGVNLYDIKNWNNLDSDNLEVGQKLIVSGDETTQTGASKLPENTLVKDAVSTQEVISEDPTRKEGFGRSHIVKKGETLYSISKKYALSQEELVKINNLTNNN